MTVSMLRTYTDQWKRDKKPIDENRCTRLIDLARDGFEVDQEEVKFLEELLKQPDRFDSQATMEKVRSFIASVPKPVDRSGAGFEASEGHDKTQVNDDELWIGTKDVQRMVMDTGIIPTTGGYLALTDNVLGSVRHGSKVPKTPKMSAAEADAMQKSTLGDAVTRMAAACGKQFDIRDEFDEKKQLTLHQVFSAMPYYKEGAEGWEGACQSVAALNSHKGLCDLIEQMGAKDGERGIFFGGEFISKADVRNMVIGLFSQIYANPDARLAGESFRLTPLKMMRFVAENVAQGKTVIVDTHNDVMEGTNEKWNYAICKAVLDTKTLTGDVAQKLLALAQQPNYDHIEPEKMQQLAQGKAIVKQCTLEMHYGEDDFPNSNGYEGTKPMMAEPKTMTVYTVSLLSGEVVAAFNDYEDKIKEIPGLTKPDSAYLPDYAWTPDLKIFDDAMKGIDNPLIQNHQLCDTIKFFMGTVLQKGVSPEMRKNFESDPLVNSNIGKIDAQLAMKLAAKYPGIANAYSPAEWDRNFGALGLSAKAFGAVWAK